MELIETKLLASAVLFILTLMCGYLPTRLILNQTLVQYAMFAGGGVLMATAFCHLIPEAHESYHNQNHGHSHSHHSHSHSHSHPSMNSHHDLQQQQILFNDTFATPLAANYTNATSQMISAMLQTIAKNATSALSDPLQQLASTTTTTVPPSPPPPGPDPPAPEPPGPAPDSIPTRALPYLEICLCSGFFFMYIIEQLMMRFINTHSHEHPCDSSTGQLVVSGSQSVASLAEQGCSGASSASGSGAKLTGEGGRSERHRHNSMSGGGGGGGGLSAQHAGHLYKFLRGFLIIAAFLLHSIFEGVSIGSQTSPDRVWTLLFAIGCHKFIIAAVVGLEIYATTLESNLWTLIHMTLFSLMSPIGIILVLIAQGTLHVDENDPIMILIQSFATGTVLYIVFVEILQHDNGPKSSEKNRLGKSVSLVAGFALMLLILTLTE